MYELYNKIKLLNRLLVVSVTLLAALDEEIMLSRLLSTVAVMSLLFSLPSISKCPVK